MVLYPASVLSGKKPKAQQISPLPPRREFWHRFSQRPLLGLENNIWEFLTAWFSGKWDVQKLMVGGFLKNYNSSLQECASPGCGCGLINSAVYQKMITIADKQAERDRLLLFFAFQKPGSAGRNFFNLLCIERMFARCCYILCCCSSADPATSGAAAAGCGSCSSQGSSRQQLSSLGAEAASSQASRQSGRDQPTACTACTGISAMWLENQTGGIFNFLDLWHVPQNFNCFQPTAKTKWKKCNGRKTSVAYIKLMWGCFRKVCVVMCSPPEISFCPYSGTLVRNFNCLH